MACPEENELVDLVMGNLDADQAAEAEAHIDACSACRLVLIELARIFEFRASALPEESVEDTDPSQDEVALPLVLQPAALVRGSEIGRYLVLRVLGAGAMGIVYEAYDPELDRKVALKLLRERKSDQGRSERLLREARVTAKLAHPNVVAVHDVGTHEGAVFMAIEFVDGGTLGEWQSEGRSAEDIVSAYADAARGLLAAHTAGLVHRDFKPANVLVSKDGRVRVTDFGLARLPVEDSGTEQAEPNDSLPSLELLTKTGAIVGTPAYMSPEQFAGLVADARSDQFSFCVALFEALCGERPFAGRTFSELSVNVSKGKVSATRNFDVLPKGLRLVLLRGLDPEPRNRFESMSELLACLVGPDPGRRWVPASLGGAVALGVGIFGFAVGSTQAEADPCLDELAGFSEVWTAPRKAALGERLAASGAVYAGDTVERVNARLDAYTQRWTESFEPACAASVVSAETTCLRARGRDLDNLLVALERAEPEVVEFGVEAVQKLEPPSSCRTGSTRRFVAPVPPASLADFVERTRNRLSEAKALVHTHQYDDALAATMAARDAALDVGYQPVLAEANLLAGRIYVELDRVAEAEQALMASSREAWSSGHERVALEAAMELVHVTGIYEDHPEAGRVWAELGTAALDRVGGSDELEGMLAEARGSLAHHVGDFSAAEADLRTALELRSKVLPPDDVALSYTHARLATALHERGEFVEALEHFRFALEIHSAALGPRHPSVVHEMASVGGTLLLLGRSEEASAILEQAVELGEAVGTTPGRLGSYLVKLAMLATRRGEFDDADALLRRSLKLHLDNGIGGRALSAVHHSTANNAFMAGRDDDAVVAFGQSIEVLSTLEGAQDDLGHALVSQAVVLLSSERCSEAVAQVERALELLEGPGGTESEKVYAQTYYAYALLCTDNPRQAAEVAREAYAVAAVDPDMATKRETLSEVLSDALFELGDAKGSEAAARQALADSMSPIEEAAASFRIARVTVGTDRVAAVKLAREALPKAPQRDRTAIEAFLQSHG